MSSLAFLVAVFACFALAACNEWSRSHPVDPNTKAGRLMAEARALYEGPRSRLYDTPNLAQQVHLVFGADETQYVVQFVSFNLDGGAASVVQYGPDPSNLMYQRNGQPFIFTDVRCSNSSRVMHNLTMDSLVPDQRTYYRVSADGGQTWTDIATFVPIKRLDSSRPFTVDLVGDMGLYPVACNVSSLFQWAGDIASGIAEFVIHYGDIGYNLDDNCNQLGDLYMNQATGVGNATSYVFGPGNHETDYLYTYHTYTNRYAGQTPLAAASGSPNVRWFSFDVGMVHFVMFDTDAWIYLPVVPLAQPQWEWMAADLAKVNRSVTPWVIVIGHRAMYCTKNNDNECNSEAETIRYGFDYTTYGIEELMLQYGADMYFAGHTHHYMRTWPVKKGELVQANYVNPGGVVHIQSGIGGVDGGDPFELPMKVYDAWRDENYYVSYSRLQFHNATHVTFTQHRADDGSILDSFVLEQHNHGPFV